MKKLLDLVGGHHRPTIVDDQRQALEHRIGAERDDDGGQPQAHGEDAVEQPEQPAPKTDAAQGRQPGIDPGDHQQRRQHGREIEHPADRQVDLADRQQEHHADRQHAEEGGVAENRRAD